MIVVADTSVLLNLAFVGLGDVLRILFGEVWMPETVVQEFERMSASNGRFKGLALPTSCKACVVTRLPVEILTDSRLDAGEAEALGFAIESKADAVLMDEVAGRAVAAHFGIEVIGTAGLLIIAKRHGLVAQVAPVLRKLIVEGRFRLSGDLLREVLRRAGELP